MKATKTEKNPILLAITLIPVAVASNLGLMEQNQEPNNILASDLLSATGETQQDQRKTFQTDFVFTDVPHKNWRREFYYISIQTS